MAIIKKSINNKMLERMWRKGNPPTLLWKTVWRVLRKLIIEASDDPTSPLLGTYLDKATIQKDTCTPVFLAVVFTIAKAPRAQVEGTQRPGSHASVFGPCVHTVDTAHFPMRN